MPSEKYSRRQITQAWVRHWLIASAFAWCAAVWGTPTVHAIVVVLAFPALVVLIHSDTTAWNPMEGESQMPLQYWKRVGRWWVGLVFVGVDLDPDSELGEVVEELTEDD